MSLYLYSLKANNLDRKRHRKRDLLKIYTFIIVIWVEQELLTLAKHPSSFSVFSVIYVAQSFLCSVLQIIVYMFAHWIVCPAIYGFWLPISYLQTFQSILKHKISHYIFLDVLYVTLNWRPSYCTKEYNNVMSVYPYFRHTSKELKECWNYHWIFPIFTYSYIANSSWHWGSYGSIWTGPSPKKYYITYSYIYIRLKIKPNSVRIRF